MNHFERILCQGQTPQHHNLLENEYLYDKSTDQSNLISTALEHVHSPFDVSPKASMFFLSMNSPRHTADNLHFNTQLARFTKSYKDNIQPIARRLHFEEQPSLSCQQEQLEQEQDQDQDSNKQQKQWNAPSNTPQKGKKINKIKNTKGLKSLSVGVYEIVAEKTETTYKQVAQTLISKLSKKGKYKQTSQGQCELFLNVQKDQHNIKRRVYDALNVLISAQLLRKQGKRVIYNFNLKRQQGNRHSLQSQYDKLRIQIRNQQQRIQQKRCLLAQLQTKYTKIRGLFTKNVKLGPNYPETIGLPFVVAKINTNNIQTISIGKQDVQIQYKGNIIIMGDIDTIEEMEG